MAPKFSAEADRAAEAAATPLESFGARLAARRAALGNPDMPRNAGTRRTASKTALLRAIMKAGGTW